MEPGALLGERFRLRERADVEWRGEVYAATDEARDGAPCRVEVVHASGKQAEQFERLVQREVAIGDWLEEVPDVLRALSWGRVESNGLFVARAWVEGAAPFDLRTGDLEERVWRVLSLAQTVAGLSERGVVHRDLGLGSVVAGPDEGVYLAGFGLARLDEVAEPWSGPYGLPFLNLRSVAPECFERPGEADPRTDVYALGVLLYRALCARWPFPGPSLPQLVRQQEAARHGRADPPRPSHHAPDLPAALDELTTRAMALDPADRIAKAGEFIDELEAWLAVPAGAVEPAERDSSDLGALDLTADAEPEPPTRDALADESDLENSSVETASEDATVPEPLDLPELPSTPEPLPEVTPPAPAVEEEDPGELLPPTSFQGFDVVAGGVLVLRVEARHLESMVANLRQVDPDGLRGVLLDMTGVEHLGGTQLEALTEVLTIAQRRQLPAGMYGVVRSLKLIIRRVEIEVHVPRILKAAEEEDALQELEESSA